MARLGENIRLGAPFGVRLGVQGLVLALVAGFAVYGLVTKNISDAVWFPLLYGSVFLHELAHAVTARAFGGRVDGIVIHLMGGVTLTRGLRRPLARILMTAAGPATNLALAAVIWFVALPALAPAGGDPGVGFRVLAALMFANVLWGIFNVLPIYPMDGGHILQTIAEQRLSPARATALSALVSLCTIAAVVVLALFGRGLLGFELGSGMLFLFLGFFAWANIQRWRGAAQSGGPVTRFARAIGKAGGNGDRAPRPGPAASRRVMAADSRDPVEDSEHMRALLRHAARVGLAGLSPDDRRIILRHRTMIEAELTRSGFAGLSEDQRELLALHHEMEDRSPPH